MSIEFYKNQLSLLIEGKVTSVAQDADGELFGLTIVKHNKKYIVWFLEDDEGNGPGSFEIQPM